MSGFELYIDGVGWWSSGAPSWAAAAPALRGEAAAPSADPKPARPAPAALAANERRRAPDSVLLALEVASAALQGSGHDPAVVASVFTSAHGDLTITDALCLTLANEPRLLSPTRFHHSVHNAASGYWAIASASHAPSTALAASEASFATGLLEAASQCAADANPVLLVGFDTEACGPLRSVNRSRDLLGVALLLSLRPSAASRWLLQIEPRPGKDAPPLPHSSLARALSDNAMVDALPLFETLARESASAQSLPVRLSPALQLQLTLRHLGRSAA